MVTEDANDVNVEMLLPCYDDDDLEIRSSSSCFSSSGIISENVERMDPTSSTKIRRKDEPVCFQGVRQQWSHQVEEMRLRYSIVHDCITFHEPDENDSTGERLRVLACTNRGDLHLWALHSRASVDDNKTNIPDQPICRWNLEVGDLLRIKIVSVSLTGIHTAARILYVATGNGGILAFDWQAMIETASADCRDTPVPMMRYDPYPTLYPPGFPAVLDFFVLENRIIALTDDTWNLYCFDRNDGRNIITRRNSQMGKILAFDKQNDECFIFGTDLGFVYSWEIGDCDKNGQPDTSLNLLGGKCIDSKIDLRNLLGFPFVQVTDLYVADYCWMIVGSVNGKPHGEGPGKGFLMTIHLHTKAILKKVILEEIPLRLIPSSPSTKDKVLLVANTPVVKLWRVISLELVESFVTDLKQCCAVAATGSGLFVVAGRGNPLEVFMYHTSLGIGVLPSLRIGTLTPV